MGDLPAVRVVGILATHNLVQNYLLNEKGYVPGNLVVSALLVGACRRSGSNWDEMGFGRPDLTATARYGAFAAITVSVAAVGIMSHPRARTLLQDRRARVRGRAEMLRRAVVRFPLGTALFEEIAFRGVLPCSLTRNHGTWRADALSAVAFAIWHLIPTARAQAGSPVLRQRRAAGVIAGSAVAGVAGLGLSWLRRKTGSLLAPWLVHAIVNSIAFLAGVATQRRSDEA